MTGVECRAFRRIGRGTCPETPHTWECGCVPKRLKGFAKSRLLGASRRQNSHHKRHSSSMLSDSAQPYAFTRWKRKAGRLICPDARLFIVSVAEGDDLPFLQ